jgi:RNA polymerase sigma-70 factor (ECF subfamily)
MTRGSADDDGQLFDRLVAAHTGCVTRLAHRLLGWSGDVEDVVQDVFLAAYKNLPKFRGDADPRTWLIRITINRCHTQRRRRWLRWQRLRDHVHDGHDDQAASADQDSLDRDTSRQVRTAVQQLSQKYRDVIVLRYLEQMPTESICEVLNIARSTLDVRLHRARNQLKEMLGDLVEE